ncbi:hypothetical protein I8J29_31885, partial [Paenibacillus sp. MWE-103]|nr:hypothetical protein [Paenibacillus artemisiicola]
MQFRTLRELAEQAEARGLSIGRYMLEEQAAETGRPPEEEFAQMAAYYGIMKEAVRRGLTQDTTSRSGLTGRDAQRVMAYRDEGAPPWAMRGADGAAEAPGGMAKTGTPGAEPGEMPGAAARRPGAVPGAAPGGAQAPGPEEIPDTPAAPAARRPGAVPAEAAGGAEAPSPADMPAAPFVP